MAVWTTVPYRHGADILANRHVYHLQVSARWFERTGGPFHCCATVRSCVMGFAASTGINDPTDELGQL